MWQYEDTYSSMRTHIYNSMRTHIHRHATHAVGVSRDKGSKDFKA